MNKKGFANIILVAVVVILIGVVGYFALVREPVLIAPSTEQPTPADETANLKTYRNEEQSIEFRYPGHISVASPSYETDRAKAWGEYTISVDNRHFLNAISLQGAKELDRANSQCEGFCFVTWTTAEQWIKHQAVLGSGVSGLVGEKDCLVTSKCKIEQIGENKFLVIYGIAAGPYSSTRKQYVTYHRDIRYEFYSVIPSTKTENYKVIYPTIEETDAFEHSDNYGQIVRNILLTLKFLR